MDYEPDAVLEEHDMKLNSGFSSLGFKFKVIRPPEGSIPAQVEVKRYIGDAEDLCIPSEICGCWVVSLGKSSLAECRSLKSVTVPEGIVSVGDWAFCLCINLERIVLPHSLSSVGANAFRNCHALTALEFPEGTESIGQWCMHRCLCLESVRIPSTVRSIGRCAFDMCIALKSIEVAEGNSVYSSRSGMLYDVSGTELILCPARVERDVRLPEGTVSISVDGFRKFGRMESVTLPQGLEYVEDLYLYLSEFPE